jgi:hypothetical protein
MICEIKTNVKRMLGHFNSLINIINNFNESFQYFALEGWV